MRVLCRGKKREKEGMKNFASLRCESKKLRGVPRKGKKKKKGLGCTRRGKRGGQIQCHLCMPFEKKKRGKGPHKPGGRREHVVLRDLALY